jgi:hypothetical protein
VLEAENKVKIAETVCFFLRFLLMLFGTGTYFYRQKVRNNKIILAQKTELDELNATKDKLFSIVSHDLRSSVNALKVSNGKLQESLETKTLQSWIPNCITTVPLPMVPIICWTIYSIGLCCKPNNPILTRSLRLFFIVEQMVYNYTDAR